MSLPTQCSLLKIDFMDDVTRVTFVQKSLDDANVHTIGEHLYGLIDQQGRRKLQLDFSRVEVVTSAGLGKLVALHKKMQTVGGHVSLHNLRERTYEVFEVTRLNTLLDIRRNQRGAGAA
jgi:anti-sigma B factor antagonist